MEQFLQVGAITSTHGIRGEVKVFPTTDDPARFKKLKKVILDTGKRQIDMEIQSVRFFKQFVIVKFKGIDNINDWMNNPAMKNIDPIKLELIKTAASKTSGKSGKELAPIMMALISGANKQGIRFTPEEMTLILDILKDGKSKEEREQIDRTINMASSLFRKHNGK